jgi:hypothetical protein
MAAWIVAREIEWLDVPAYQRAAARLLRDLARRLGTYYETRCLACQATAEVKYFSFVPNLRDTPLTPPSA